MSLEPRNYLRSARKKVGLTQPDMALLLSLEQRTIVSKLENRKQPITAQVLLTYCLIFDCHPADLLPDLATDIAQLTTSNAAVLINLSPPASTALAELRQESLQLIFTRCLNH
jgi:transcriptional regulator with XRE-family HTH domain